MSIEPFPIARGDDGLYRVPVGPVARALVKMAVEARATKVAKAHADLKREQDIAKDAIEAAEAEWSQVAKLVWGEHGVPERAMLDAATGGDWSLVWGDEEAPTSAPQDS